MGLITLSPTLHLVRSYFDYNRVMKSPLVLSHSHFHDIFTPVPTAAPAAVDTMGTTEKAQKAAVGGNGAARVLVPGGGALICFVPFFTFREGQIYCIEMKRGIIIYLDVYRQGPFCSCMFLHEGRGEPLNHFPGLGFVSGETHTLFVPFQAMLQLHSMAM